MDESQISEVLRKAQYPFNWDLPKPDMPVDQFVNVYIEKLNNSEEESNFQYNRVNLSLIVAYELCDKQADYTAALTHLTFCADHLASLELAECQEPLYTAVRTVLTHVITAFKTHVLLAAGRTQEAAREVKKIKPANLKNSREKAGFLGMKAALQVYYAPKGHHLAKESAREAKTLAPEQAEWHFIYGIALGRIRRVDYGPISDEEINAIEKASALQRNSSYVVHLATLYADRSSEIFFTARQEKEQAKAYASMAIARYKEALELSPNSSSLLKARVAHGLVRIRFVEMVDPRYVKKLLEEVIRDMPNYSMAYHDLGYYFYKIEKNKDKAIASLKKANELKNIRALILLIYVIWKNNTPEDVIPVLEEGLKKYPSEENQAEILTNLGACYWLQNHKEKALDCFKRLLGISGCDRYWQKYGGFDQGRKTNLIQLVVDHLRCNIKDYEKKEVYKHFLDFIEKVRPALFDVKPVDTLRSWEKKQVAAQRWS